MKCRYCFRWLREIPHTPAEIEPHCRAGRCVWCRECAAGLTPVSPRWPGTYPPLRREGGGTEKAA